MPVWAVSSGESVVRGTGIDQGDVRYNLLADDGDLHLPVVSLMMANWETSAPVPAVVGMQISGGGGIWTLSTPSNSRISRWFEKTIPIPLAQSIGLPPPITTMLSQPGFAEDLCPFHNLVVPGVRGNTVKQGVPYTLPVKAGDNVGHPACLVHVQAASPRAGGVPEVFAYRPARSRAFSPTINSGATNFRSSNLDLSTPLTSSDTFPVNSIKERHVFQGMDY